VLLTRFPWDVDPDQELGRKYPMQPGGFQPRYTIRPFTGLRSRPPHRIPGTEVTETTVPLTDSFSYTIPLTVACGIHPVCFGRGYYVEGNCVFWDMYLVLVLYNCTTPCIFCFFSNEINVSLQMTNTQLPPTRHKKYPGYYYMVPNNDGQTKY
jgi:hypothetical protein